MYLLRGATSVASGMPQTDGEVMFKFLFRGRDKTPEVKIETQRETFTRLVEELNDALGKLADKPAVTIEPATGRISFELPEQFPDEALALPSPEGEATETEQQEPAPPADEETANEKASEPASSAEAASDAANDTSTTSAPKRGPR